MSVVDTSPSWSVARTRTRLTRLLVGRTAITIAVNHRVVMAQQVLRQRVRPAAMPSAVRRHRRARRSHPPPSPASQWSPRSH
ncbi:MAG: hypothetical protein MZV49_12395 [Rhodopseudomonas palustris]|nr:hypothetical protein [Rhodopseudomonas palustris]